MALGAARPAGHQSRTFRDFEVYAVVAGIYLALALAMRVMFSGIYLLAFGRR